jgi:beta-glucuronidase
VISAAFMLALLSLAAGNSGRPPLVAVAPQQVSLSGSWRFSVDPHRTGRAHGWHRAGFDDRRWAEVQVPHTWNVMPEHAGYEGLGWYRRSFTLPKGAGGARVTLRFAAVFYRARVWVNGRHAGTHEGGYTPFELDVGGLLVRSRNVIAVEVDNRRSFDRIPAQLTRDWSFDWWNYGGIVRNVEVRLTSQAFIAATRVTAVPHITAPDEADGATVIVATTVRNDSRRALDGRVALQVLDGITGAQVAAGEGGIVAAPGHARTLRLELAVAEPRLWHFDHPSLYRLVTTLKGASGTELDRAEETFGIRSVELRSNGIYLNGERVRLVGVTRHADSRQHGLAETTQVMAADYDDLKRLNEVLSRPVHYPQADFVLDYCDRNGILLVPEVPAWQLSRDQLAVPRMRALERTQLREMITSEANHPSIWAWSVANEIDSQSVEGWNFVKEMIAYVKRLDPTRPVGFASNRLDESPELDATRFSDFILMNEYFGSWAGPQQEFGPALDRVHAAFPGKTVLVSEYGLEPHWYELGGPGPGVIDHERYFGVPPNVDAASEEADVERGKVIAAQLAVMRTKPYVAGAIYWTYQDYRTRTDFVMGVVDPDRHRRGTWQLLRDEYSPVRLDAVRFADVADGRRSATVELRARGPVDTDLPAYTLRGYTLRWAVTARGGTTLSTGTVPLPTLAPAARWTGSIDWPLPVQDYVFEVSVVRPTGFAVFERTFDPRGG